MALEVVSRCSEYRRIVFGAAEQIVAVVAKKSAVLFSLVAVVYRQLLKPPVTYHRLWLATYRASAVLGRQHFSVLIRRYSVIAAQVSLPEISCPRLAPYPLSLQQFRIFLRGFALQWNEVIDAAIVCVAVRKSYSGWWLRSLNQPPNYVMHQKKVSSDFYPPNIVRRSSPVGMETAGNRPRLHAGPSGRPIPSERFRNGRIICEQFVQNFLREFHPLYVSRSGGCFKL